MTPFQRFIRLYNPKGVMFAGCGLVLAGLTLTIGGFLVENMVVVMTGFIVVVTMIVVTLLCTILAVTRVDGRMTPGRDIILATGLSDITHDEVIDAVNRDAAAFMADLKRHIPRFQYAGDRAD